MIIGWSAPHSESRRLIHGTGAAGKPVNGNPLLKAPSTVNNKPIHGAKVRFRTVVSAIAIQCTPKRKCFRVIERPPCGLPSDDFADVLVLGHSEICNFLPPRENPREYRWHPLNMPQPSIHVRNLLETVVLHLQHSPDLSEEEVRWIQQFAAHLITEFSVLHEDDLLYAALEDEASVER